MVDALPEDSDIVIDGLRFSEDYAFLLENFGPGTSTLARPSKCETLVLLPVKVAATFCIKLKVNPLSRSSIGKLEVFPMLPYPAIQEGMFLITFADASDFDGKLGPEMYIAEPSEPIDVAGLLAETDFGKHLFQLLRLAWEQMLVERKLPVYELANKAKCFYFTKGRAPKDKVFFTGVDSVRTYRAMVGFSTRTNPTTGVRTKRYWHFAVHPRRRCL